MRSAAGIAVLAATALLWGIVVTMLTDGRGWPWFVAPASVVALAGAFGWLCRGREIAHVFGAAFVLSYAALAGLALVRFAELDPWQATALVFPYSAHWPAIAVGTIPFALMCAIFIAMPASLVPLRRRRPSRAGERFWAFIRERNAALAGANAARPERDR
jgi:hypothetical protein